MDAAIGRTTWRTLEPIDGMISLVPEDPALYRNAGHLDERSGYFASRSAGLSEASAGLLTATVYNFGPV